MRDDFAHRAHDALPTPVTSALDTAASVLTGNNLSTVVNAAKLLNDGYSWCRGGGAATRELKEEAALLNEMELHPERLRSASPKTCEKRQLIGGRLLLRQAKSLAPAETTAQIRELYKSTVGICAEKCLEKKSG